MENITTYEAGEYQVAVIGAGHAGIEAALASARLGCRTIMFAINMDSIGNMPCNPSIGGTAKGHLVREIDALGGEMGKAADKTFLQLRMLNLGKGPAVHSLRAQVDRRAYGTLMKHTVELQENLDVRQAEVCEILFDGNKVCGVAVHTGAIYRCKAVVIASGTYLKSRIIMGEVNYSGGPDGMFPANSLSECLKNKGIELMRFKTGTPARVHKASVDTSVMEPQGGDEEIVPFSFENEGREDFENKVNCYLTYTGHETHEIIRANLHRSPIYSGRIKGIGPRYCPSIEDKVVRFSDKDRHQLFIEPMGMDTEEMYVQGMSSSLPEEVQIKMMRTVKGLENVRIMRAAYAIEYDCVNPLQLHHTLEFKEISGLYGAGQFNGTSGYEEAAAQGLVAGINAARKVLGKEQITIGRDKAYIGTLIDDLVTKGTQEPYRMMTSRSEYRLILRQDNADERLTPLGHEIGLISDERYEKFLNKQEEIQREIARLEKNVLAPTEAVNDYLVLKNSVPIKTGIKYAELLRRPEITYKNLQAICPEMPHIGREIIEQAEIRIKYEGYIRRQYSQIAQFKKLENKKLDENMDYTSILGLRIEARQKLAKIKPVSIGQASRISGVSPSDIAVLLIYLEQRGGKNERQTD
ncbi:MAG: tRNA uridine-5-carboxymethylaminomethyl(34) synthesis enzyme MnmG [Bacillota bacterium]|nr:tRNA uridine-5-carboxymethylaminomethyl(34) synthesis enzyme MnmG [Bacillota bacterium]